MRSHRCDDKVVYISPWGVCWAVASRMALLLLAVVVVGPEGVAPAVITFLVLADLSALCGAIGGLNAGLLAGEAAGLPHWDPTWSRASLAPMDFVEPRTSHSMLGTSGIRIAPGGV